MAARLDELDRTSTAWRPIGQGWSLAGAQRKLAMYRDSQGRWGIPSGATPTTHIIKPAIAGFADHDLNEHLSMATAARMGLSAASSSLERFGERTALVVTRYDRVRAPDQTVQRVHQEDMAQALGVHPEMKYEADGGPSIADIGAVIRTYSSAAEADVARFRDALIFNWLIRGPDAHAKNYSMLLSGQDARLAPLYDVASDAPYPARRRQKRLAHRIGGEGRPTWIRERHDRANPRAARHARSGSERGGRRGGVGRRSTRSGGQSDCISDHESRRSRGQRTSSRRHRRRLRRWSGAESSFRFSSAELSLGHRG